MSLRAPAKAIAMSSLAGQPSKPGASDASEVPHIQSNALLRGAREVVIRHGHELYRLRQTRNDKLILTK